MIRFAHDRLRTAREDKGLSRPELAAQVGRSHQSLKRYELDMEPPLSVTARLCRVLGLELTNLIEELGGDGPRPA